MKKDSKIFVADHESLTGGGILEALNKKGYSRIICSHDLHRTVDLKDSRSVNSFFADVSPDYVFLSVGFSAGIMTNIMRPAEFIYENIMTALNVLHAAREFGVKKVLVFGSSCMYPVNAPFPISEDSILTGEVEKTSEANAVARIAMLKACEAFYKQYGLEYIMVVPATFYGPGGRFDQANSHVISALIARFHEAKVKNWPKVTVWGSGYPMREFIFIEDLSDACVLLMESDQVGIFNVAPLMEEIYIRELAVSIGRIINFQGRTEFDPTKPDGVFRKPLSTAKIRDLGWKPKVSLREGIERTYSWYKARLASSAEV